MEQIKIVIADDHVLFRAGTRSLLEQEPDLKVVGEASDGKEAVDLVAELRPNVVLMDIAMPKVNGIEATRQIKAHHSSTAVLILTAYDNDQYVLAILQAGAAGYLLKNARGSDLINAIRSVCAGEAVLDHTIAAKVFKRLAVPGQERPGVVLAEDLTEREIEILKLAAKGFTNKEIAAKLFLSRRTVQTHLANIFHKLEVGSRTEAILQALKRGWLVLNDVA